MASGNDGKVISGNRGAAEFTFHLEDLTEKCQTVADSHSFSASSVGNVQY